MKATRFPFSSAVSCSSNTQIEKLNRILQGQAALQVVHLVVQAPTGIKLRGWRKIEHAYAPYAAPEVGAVFDLLHLGGMPGNMLILRGHASKQMIFNVYGKYTEGLEQDRLAILRYFGRDFRSPGKRIAPVACESSCESRGRFF